jgi:NADPH-dependent curcumin reductase CurA
VIAFAGSEEKVNWCKNELNFDFVYNYKNVNISDAINEAAPHGVDIFFDNVISFFFNKFYSLY